MSLRPTFRPALRVCLAGCLLAVMGLSVHAQAVVQIKVTQDHAGLAVNPGYTGLSLEMQYVLADTNGNHFFSPDNKRLIATFKTLGIRSLRVGGNTADRPTLPTPSEADVDSLFAFAKAAGVKVIYTLRLNQGDIGVAVHMANYILRHYPKQLACFAIGNEPNVFSKQYAPYLEEWKKYAAEITAPANSPGATFCGPSTSPGHETWAANFANEFGNHGPLALIAQHDYPGGDARRATNAALARDKILAPAIDEHYAKFSDNFVPTVLSNGLPYRLEEANSFYDGGAFDVSDTFASALWALDYQWWWAAHGASGINFHTGDKVAARDESKPCRYAVFWTVPDGYNVHPIGYALKMFSLGSRGRLLTTQVENTNDLNLAVYAVAKGKNNLYMTLINREHGEAGRTANIQLDSGFGNARAETLSLTATGGDIATKTGITLGGDEIQDNGKWNGKWGRIDAPNGILIFELPAASATLVKITKR